MLKSKKAQITVFVIIAIVLVLGIVGFFVFRDVFAPGVPKNIAPVYDYYISCLEDTVSDGASIMGSQAGYIILPEFAPGSEYAPFSNQLEFMGMGVPYWYYISGNGIAKEQIPTKAEMERQLADFLKEQAGNCNFDSFRTQGFNITLENATSARADIGDENIAISLNQRIIIEKDGARFALSSQDFQVDSLLGKLYDTASEIYNYEKNTMFLENYSKDFLYTYAPVSGVNFECAPSVWNPYDVFNRLKSALESNIQAIKIEGEYYDVRNQYTNYFIAGKGSNIDLGNNQASFLYSKNWPSRFEVWPTENSLMTANPLGNQPGLGAMGFCYTPYKFVYDVYIPVLVQIYNPTDADLVFQFPVAVVINKNVAREAQTPASDFVAPSESVCNRPSTNITIYTYDINLDPIDANIKFKCINDVCNLGRTKIDNATGYAMLSAAVPACYNGVVVAESEGYKQKSYLISTNEESIADIVLDKEYSLQLEVYVDGRITNNLAILTLAEDIENITQSSTAISYPYNKKADVGEGYYDFDLRVYGEGSVRIPEMTSTQCAEVPQSGIAGLFGLTEEKCTDVVIPAQQVQNFLIAGGSTKHYILPADLEGRSILRVYATSIKTPSSLDDVALSWDIIDNKNIYVEIV